MADPQTEQLTKAVSNLVATLSEHKQMTRDLPMAIQKTCLDGLRDHTEGFQKLMGQTLESANIAMKAKEDSAVKEKKELQKTLEEIRSTSEQMRGAAKEFKEATDSLKGTLQSNVLGFLIATTIAVAVGVSITLLIYSNWEKNYDKRTLIKADAYDMLNKNAKEESDIEWITRCYNVAEKNRFPPPKQNNQ
jgi:hypothetical protein